MREPQLKPSSGFAAPRHFSATSALSDCSSDRGMFGQSCGTPAVVRALNILALSGSEASAELSAALLQSSVSFCVWSASISSASSGMR